MYVESVLKVKGSSVVTAKPDMPVNLVAKLLADARIGAVVSSAADVHVAGLPSERDNVARMPRMGEGALGVPATALMTREVVTCSPKDHIAGLMAVMTEKHIRHLPVLVDGGLAGIISIGDVVKCRVQEVESEAEALRAYVTQG